jgi:glutathione S-transferase
MTQLRVFTFGSDWGLPTTGPFALKLLTWLDYSGIGYEQVVQNDSRKGPLGKSPWIEHDGLRLGDSDAIIRYLANRFGVDPLNAFDTPLKAAAHAWKIAFEERFHQILEWELFIHPEGAAYVDAAVRNEAPPFVAGVIVRSLRRHFARQLHARGIARHSPDEIAEKGRADIDALAQVVGKRPFLAGDAPVLADFAVYGQVAPMIRWPMATPVAAYARSVPAVVEWCERVRTARLGDRANVGSPPISEIRTGT